MAFVRRKGKSYYLVHNVRHRGKIRQLHLAHLGRRPRITDEVVRQVSRNHPLLEVDWPRVREHVNGHAELIQSDSPYVQGLMESVRGLNLDLAELTPPLLLLTDHDSASSEFLTELRLLRSTLEIKLNQFKRAVPRDFSAGRKSR